MSQYGLKNIDPAFQSHVGYKVTPDEIDRYERYTILHASAGTKEVGTAAGTAVSGVVDLTNTQLDYPRNLQVIATGKVGTVVISGQDQFGGSITETIAGGTTVGTLVFARVGTATYTKATGAGTIEVGYASGTTSASPLFGLPFKVGGTADLKKATWLDSDASKPMTNGGTASPAVEVDTDLHAVRLEVTGGIAAADSFDLWFRPSYNASSDTDEQAGL